MSPGTSRRGSGPRARPPKGRVAGQSASPATETRRLAIVSEAFARKYWPGGSAIGRTVYERTLNSGVSFEIVGVVADHKQQTVGEGDRPTIYFSSTQRPNAYNVVIARTAGLSDEEISRVAAGPDAQEWDPFEAHLLRAVDELHDDACVTEPTYTAIAARYDEQQMLDLVFTVGQYHLVSMALNTFRVERDDGVTGMPIPDR